MDLSNVVVYDVEIIKEPRSVLGGWDNPAGMGFASAVVYDYADDMYYFYLNNFLSQGQRRERNHRVLELVKKLQGRTVVSFNGIKFDSKVLLTNNRVMDKSGRTSIGKVWWDNVDILVEYARSRFGIVTIKNAIEKLADRNLHDGTFSLDAICKKTVGRGKNGEGALAPRLFLEKRYGELLQYNFNDVRITKMLFDFIVKNEYLIDGKNNKTEIKLK